MGSVIEILIISVGLALDAVSVSASLGFKVKTQRARKSLRAAIYFGSFQLGMAFIGWLVGNSVLDYIENFSKWIAFILLSAVSLKMLYEAIRFSEEDVKEDVNASRMIALSFATSIDALIVGTTIALLNIPVFLSLISIGAVTFGLSFLSYFFATHFGKYFGKYLEYVGSIAIFAIGLSFLLR